MVHLKWKRVERAQIWGTEEKTLTIPNPSPSVIKGRVSYWWPQRGAEDYRLVHIATKMQQRHKRIGRSAQNKQVIGPGLTSELMLSALGLTRMVLSRASLWWQRVLWPEGEM